MAHSKLSFPEQAAVDCDLCEGHVKVDWYCLTCPANLCEKCKVLHTTRKNFRKHKVLSRDLHKKQQELGEPERVHKCPSHTHNDVVMMCITCGVPVCNECILSTHNGHVFEGLQAKLERSIENLSKYLEKLNQKDNSILDQLKKNNDVLKSVDDETQETKKEIIKRRDAVMASVKAESDRLIEQMETRRRENKSSIATSNSNLRSAHDRIQDIIKKAQTKLDGASSTDIDSFLKEAEKTDDINVSVDIRLYTTKFHAQALQSTPRIGTLHLEDLTVHTAPLFPTFSDVKVIETFTASLQASEIRAISSTKMWCGYFNDKSLRLYDINGKNLNSLSFGFNVQGFVINKMGNFIVCDLSDKSIKHVTPVGRVSTRCSTSPQKPLGICLNHKQQPVICTGNSLVIYSSDCKIKLQEFTQDQHGNVLFAFSYRVAMNGDTDYCVADMRGKKVVTIDLEGSLRWTYRGEPVQENIEPTNICCDSHMCVFVADTHTDKVHVLDKDGHFLMYITDSVKIDQPRGLTVSCEGTLWIGEDDPSKKVHVVKYLSK